MRVQPSRHPLILALCLALIPPALAVPGAARAAEITEVADAADGEDPFDLELELGWNRVLKQSKITRENLQGGGILDVTELRHKQVISEMQIRARAGLYKDLEINFMLPIVFADTQTWRSADLDGLPQQSTIFQQDGICPNGTIDTVNCTGAMFDFDPFVGSDNNSYRGGLGDFHVGLAWGILNDERDRYDPSWTIGFDWQAPTADKRSQSNVSHDSANPAAIGEKTNYFTFYTALSKNLGLVDPFVDFHYRLPSPQVPHAWHNCENPSNLADFDPDDDQVGTTCTNDPIGHEWVREGNNRGGYMPSHVGGMTFGAEFLPYVDPERYVRVAFQLSFTADYVSEGRVFNELSDALQKSLYGDEFLRLSGTLGVRVQASRYAKFHVLATYGHETEHFLTGESIGKDLDDTGLVELPGIDTDPTSDVSPNPEQNPNYDFRYDQPGRRFRVEETTLFGIMLTGEVNF
ncbi:MAG: hypothetical protein P1V51_10130 [Deltaproteobacteria bacterium]|nr:hypothetical protein [Deltaproteobacteria bacterium]